MKLPRDLSSVELEKALRRTFGSSPRPAGNTTSPSRVTIPLRPGTLRAILGEVMEHHHITLDELLRKLDLA